MYLYVYTHVHNMPQQKSIYKEAQTDVDQQAPKLHGVFDYILAIATNTLYFWLIYVSGKGWKPSGDFVAAPERFSADSTS